MSEWRPIETAPRDGTSVLLYKPDERRVGEYMLAGYFDDTGGIWDGKWVAVHGTSLGYFSEWQGADQGYPTHWMPLPDAPVVEENIPEGVGEP